MADKRTQTEIDTSKARSETTPSVYIPHAVRVAALRKSGLNAGEANRMASYQTSSAGLAQTAQNTGQPGELPDARANPPRNQRSQGNGVGQGDTGQGGSRQGAGGQPPPASSPKITMDDRTVARIDARDPSTYTARQRAQANFEKAKIEGRVTDQKKKEAKAFAKSNGWNFNDKTGYSMPEEKAGTASFTMPDGTKPEITRSQRPSPDGTPTREDAVAAGVERQKKYRAERKSRVAEEALPTTEQEAMDGLAKRGVKTYEGANGDFIATRGPTPNDVEIDWDAVAEASEPTSEPTPEQAEPENTDQPAAETEVFKNEDLEMLPDTVAGRIRGAKAGNSYIAKNGDVWRNDGEGSYSIEKAGGDARVSRQQLDDRKRRSDRLDAKYKKDYPGGHDENGPVDITTIDNDPDPDKKPVPTGAELKKKKLESDSEFAKQLSELVGEGSDSPNHIKKMRALAKQRALDKQDGLRFDRGKGLINK